MSERKPPDVPWEPWVERQIREAMERGEFDDLPGLGQPLPGLSGRDDELWWLREKLRREGHYELPPALALRKEHAETMDRIATARSEAEVRRLAAAINERIIYVNSHTTYGPPSNLAPLDVDHVLEQWRHRGA
jgi:hypothetical protein